MLPVSLVNAPECDEPIENASWLSQTKFQRFFFELLKLNDPSIAIF